MAAIENISIPNSIARHPATIPWTFISRPANKCPVAQLFLTNPVIIFHPPSKLCRRTARIQRSPAGRVSRDRGISLFFSTRHAPASTIRVMAYFSVFPTPSRVTTQSKVKPAGVSVEHVHTNQVEAFCFGKKTNYPSPCCCCYYCRVRKINIGARPRPVKRNCHFIRDPIKPSTVSRNFRSSRVIYKDLKVHQLLSFQ